jgi:hypothetical protein
MMPLPSCTVITVGACGEDCAALADFGCVHEHVEIAVPVCAHHLQYKRCLYCLKCLEAGHGCPMLMGNVRLVAG